MRRPEFVRATSLTCLAVCSLTHRTAAIQPMRSANKCSHQGCKTAVRCTRLHRLRAAAIFYPNFYPNSERSGVEVLYILVAALNWAGGPDVSPAFQAGHAGSIPVARSRPVSLANPWAGTVLACDFLTWLDDRCSGSPIRRFIGHRDPTLAPECGAPAGARKS